MIEGVKTADRAIEIARAFVKKHFRFCKPAKAVKEGASWLVEFEVGFLRTQIAKVKISSEMGDILEFDRLIGEKGTPRKDVKREEAPKVASRTESDY